MYKGHFHINFILLFSFIVLLKLISITMFQLIYLQLAFFYIYFII